jgi:hypothetical protein
MAKRNIRKTDPQDTSSPETPRRVPTSGRGRRKTDAARDDAAEAATPATSAATSAAVREPQPSVRVVEVTPPATDVPHEHIAVRAYHIYLERAGRSGDEFEDWIMAERQLREVASGNRSR